MFLLLLLTPPLPNLGTILRNTSFSSTIPLNSNKSSQNLLLPLADVHQIDTFNKNVNIFVFVYFSTEREQSILFNNVSFILSIHQQNTYIPVARLPGELIWRKICVSFKGLIDDLRSFMCNKLSKQPVDLDIHNVSVSDVWLAQVKYVYDKFYTHFEVNLHLNNIVEGNCSQFGRTLCWFDALTHS